MLFVEALGRAWRSGSGTSLLLFGPVIMADIPLKKAGYAMEFRHFKGKTADYLVFRTSSGEYHVFAEVEAKTAAIDCGAVDDRSRKTNDLWKAIWADS